MEPTLELQEIRKSYGDFVAVDNVSIAIPPGSVYGLLGPNGAGKSTTIRMIMDIIAPDEGTVRFFGRERSKNDQARIGYLPEERGLYQKMTVRDHLVFLAELHGLTRAAAAPRIDEWLRKVELDDRAKSKVEELSKGMQQKIQLVGTVLHEPEVLILDEPFSGLDPINQGLFRQLLSDYRDQGRTILFSTHIMEHAEKLCDHICLISDGRAILNGPLDQIKRELRGNTFRLIAEGPLDKLEQVAGVDQAVQQAGSVQLIIRPGVEGASVLRELVGFLTVHEFRSEEPDLEAIFIKAVNDAA